VGLSPFDTTTGGGGSHRRIGVKKNRDKRADERRDQEHGVNNSLKGHKDRGVERSRQGGRLKGGGDRSKFKT